MDDDNGFESFHLPAPGLLMWGIAAWAAIICLILLAFRF